MVTITDLDNLRKGYYHTVGVLFHPCLLHLAKSNCHSLDENHAIEHPLCPHDKAYALTRTHGLHYCERAYFYWLTFQMIPKASAFKNMTCKFLTCSELPAEVLFCLSTTHQSLVLPHWLIPPYLYIHVNCFCLLEYWALLSWFGLCSHDRLGVPHLEYLSEYILILSLFICLPHKTLSS